QTLIVFFSGINLFTSCESVIDMKLPEQPPKMVVNSFFTPDSIIMLHLSKSQFVLKNQELKPITDGNISLFENGKFIGKFTHINKGFYYLPGFFPKTNSQYTLNAESSGLKSVEANEIIPGKPIINRIDTSSSYYEGENYKDFIVYIEDNANEENYYQVDLLGKRYDYIYDSLTYDIIDSVEIYERVFFTSRDLVFEDQGASSQAVISDKIFNGAIYPLRLSVSSYMFDEYGYTGYFEITVQLKQVSKAYAQYLFTYSKNRYSDPFSQPVQVYSNVNNGFGIFAGYSSTLSSVKLR
ncbi:MAG: DUF4249 domain-containing protein, partial [Bacteroidia bacterium]